MMKPVVRIAAAALVSLGVNAVAAAATLNGTIMNGTTGQPAAGDEVVLLSLTGGTTEIGRGQSDSRGRFSFTVAATQSPGVVRVLHQGVAYHHPAPSGVSSVEVQVYDVSPKPGGLSATLNMRIQAEGDTLQVIEEIAVQNGSRPPRTLAPFEIQLPAEADLVAGRVRIGGGQPITGKPAPGERKGQYYFPIPLPPGAARLAVAYRLPFRGEAVIEPNIQYPLEQFVVVLPKSMRFEVETGGAFRPMRGKSEADVQVVTAAVKPGEPLAFRFYGTGTLAVGLQRDQRPALNGSKARSAAAAAALTEPRDTLHSYRWFVLGGLCLVLASGAAGFLGQRRRRLGHLSPSRTL